MDSSLDEIIASRPRGGGGGAGRRGDRRPPPARLPRRDDFPRDGVRKYRRDERANIDSDWVHDRYEDDRYEHAHRRPPIEDDRYGPPRAHQPSGTRIRVDNLHYDLTEDDLRELFERIGRVASIRILYDRADRSQGTAYVIYDDKRDAHRAIADFDGCNANGQPIRLTMMPSAPAAASKGSLADRSEAPVRSLFERIEGGPARFDSGDEGRRRRRERSDSPRRNRPMANPDVDRYIPGRGSRSPIRRRGTPREAGRRPGQRRDDGGRGPRRPRGDDDGRPMVGGRPRKTAEELDAEMADYWGSRAETTGTESAADDANGANGTTAAPTGDVDMDFVE